MEDSIEIIVKGEPVCIKIIVPVTQAGDSQGFGQAGFTGAQDFFRIFAISNIQECAKGLKRLTLFIKHEPEV